MTDLDILARLEAVAAEVAELERITAFGPEPTPFATGPGHVASGEIITAAWGNLVVDYYSRTTARIGGVQQTSLVRIEAASTAGTVDVNGLIAVTFGTAFAARPIVIASNGNYPPAGVIAGATSITASGFTLMFYTSAGPATGAQRAEWAAIGFAPN
jgi:hypothetical protein